MKVIKAAPARPVAEPMFTAENAKQCAEDLKGGIEAPYVSARPSTLGGPENVSIMFTISADPRESWTNGILQNSRYGNFSLDPDGTVEMFSGSLPKFRKRKVKGWAAFFKLFEDFLAPLRPKRKDESEYRRLDSAADEEKKAGKLDQDLYYQISAIIDNGRINADDTVHREKAAPEGEWGSIFLSSLGVLLSDESDPKVTGWFQSHGVKW
jgi:hypothetical protein